MTDCLDNIDNTWVDVLNCKKDVLNDVLDTMRDKQYLCPKYKNIFNAFRICSWNRCRIIMIGVAPYTDMSKIDYMSDISHRGDHGLAYSRLDVDIVPMETDKIYDLLIEADVMRTKPLGANLSRLAYQGVLMVNHTPTGAIGEDKAQHESAWGDYMCDIINEVCRIKSDSGQEMCVVLWGDSLIEKYAKLEHVAKHKIITSPCHLICDSKVELGEFRMREVISCAPDIDWSLEFENCIYTDGCSTIRRSPNVGGYAIYVDGGLYNGHVEYGATPQKNYNNEMQNVTNQRSEGIAILKAMLFVYREIKCRTIIVTDSQFYINTITRDMHNWLAYDNDTGKIVQYKNNIANIDIILRLFTMYHHIGDIIIFTHQRSHQDSPLDQSSLEYKRWRGNYIVDALAARGRDFESPEPRILSYSDISPVMHKKRVV